MNSCSLPLMYGGEGRAGSFVHLGGLLVARCGSRLHVHLSFVCRRAACCHTDQAQLAILMFPGGSDVSG